MYLFGNILLSILAAVIGFGVDYGYRLFNGKVDKKSPMISLVLVIVVIPLILISQAEYAVSFTNLQILYSDSIFAGAIIRI